MPRRRLLAVGCALVAGGLACSGSDASAPPATPAPGSPFEGYGAVAMGGAGGDVYHVTSLADAGPGTLRDGAVNRAGPRTIVFDLGGTITLLADLVIGQPFLTIDGSTAPAPGITLRQGRLSDEFVVAGTHDIVITHLRFQGLYVDGGPMSNNASTLNLDGDRGPDFTARRILLDHLTVRGSTDSGPDIWGPVEDVTLSWCLIFDSLHPTTVSGPRTRQRISLHHNVYARNGERNPQVRGDVRDLDYVNNVVASWGAFPSNQGGYGVRIRNDDGAKVAANIVNNAFVPQPGRLAQSALVYGDRPGGGDDGGPAASTMGRLWVAGNILPAANLDHYSTVSAPLPVPPTARVTTWPASELRSRVLPSVGTKYRDGEEEALLAELAAAMPPG
jgi:hypothetical protein